MAGPHSNGRFGPNLLVQISDLHIVEPGALVSGAIDSAALLRQTVATLLRISPKPLAVLASGDLSDHGRPAQYAHLRTLLQPIIDAGIALHLMPGNHDERQALAAAFPEMPELQPNADGFIQYKLALPGLNVLALDSVIAGSPVGALCEHRLGQLTSWLEAEPQQPALIALHHVPFTSGIGFMDAYALHEGRAALAALLRQHPQVGAVCCGHIHRSISSSLGGVPVVSAPSTAHQLPLDFRTPGEDSYVMDPPGFLLHVWGPDLPWAAFTVNSGDFGPVLPLH
jgi:3',5'-cyclic-AMP phosphodiesterase